MTTYKYENPSGFENYFGNNIKNISAVIGDFPEELPKGQLVHAIGSVHTDIFLLIETIITRRHYNDFATKEFMLVVSYPETALTMIAQNEFVSNLVELLANFEELTFTVLLRTQSPFIIGDIFSENVRAYYGDFAMTPKDHTFGASLEDRVGVGGIGYGQPKYLREKLMDNPSEELINKLGDDTLRGLALIRRMREKDMKARIHERDKHAEDYGNMRFV